MHPADMAAAACGDQCGRTVLPARSLIRAKGSRIPREASGARSCRSRSDRERPTFLPAPPPTKSYRGSAFPRCRGSRLSGTMPSCLRPQRPLASPSVRPVILYKYALGDHQILRGAERFSARSSPQEPLHASDSLQGCTAKALIEDLGVPHTEVDLIIANGRSVGFEYRLNDADLLSVYPMFESWDIGGLSRVRAAPLRETRFALDVHLGKLARLLRMVGFDAQYSNTIADEELARLARREKRIILSRDRGLLKRRTVTHGYLVRSAAPRRQLAEVLRRFDLAGSVQHVQPMHGVQSAPRARRQGLRSPASSPGGCDDLQRLFPLPGLRARVLAGYALGENESAVLPRSSDWTSAVQASKLWGFAQPFGWCGPFGLTQRFRKACFAYPFMLCESTRSISRLLRCAQPLIL